MAVKKSTFEIWLFCAFFWAKIIASSSPRSTEAFAARRNARFAKRFSHLINRTAPFFRRRPVQVRHLKTLRSPLTILSNVVVCISTHIGPPFLFFLIAVVSASSFRRPLGFPGEDRVLAHRLHRLDLQTFFHKYFRFSFGRAPAHTILDSRTRHCRHRE